MKYKIGDKVKIHSYDYYWKHKNCMSPSHSISCGKIFTIKEIVTLLDGTKRYVFVEPDCLGIHLYWKDKSIECKFDK